MKKTILLIAAMLMMGTAAFAGGDFGITLGPKVGFQTAKLSYKGAQIKSDFSNHFTAGIFGRVTIGRLYIQPEVLYFKTSNLFNVNVTGEGSSNLFNIPENANVNLTLNQMSLQVPVLIGVNIIDLNIVSLRAQVGPTASFILKSQTLVDNTYSINGTSQQMNQEQQTATTSQKFDTKSIAWGFQAGIGVDIIKRITLDINYNFGLSKLFNKLNDTSLGSYFDFSNVNESSKQNMFLVTLGFKIF